MILTINLLFVLIDGFIILLHLYRLYLFTYSLTSLFRNMFKQILSLTKSAIL